MPKIIRKTNKYTIKKSMEDKYIDSLNDKELIALKIAREHLQSSFNLTSSIGYKEYLKNNNNNNN